jgi:hypothetical protein
MPRMFLVAVFAAALLVSACSEKTPLDAPPGAKLGYQQVKEIAAEALEDEGVDLADYEQPELIFNGARHPKTWSVNYRHKDPAPAGGDYTVTIDDQSEDTKVRGGE